MNNKSSLKIRRKVKKIKKWRLLAKIMLYIEVNTTFHFNFFLNVIIVLYFYFYKVLISIKSITVYKSFKN